MRHSLSILLAVCLGGVFSNSPVRAQNSVRVAAPNDLAQPLPIGPAVSSGPVVSSYPNSTPSGYAPISPRPIPRYPVIKPLHDGPFITELRAAISVHNWEPDGTPKPLGIGNVWTEFKFAFGSGRQFYGTSDSTEGHFYRTRIRE